MPEASTPKSLEALAAQGWVSLRQFAAIIDVSYPTAFNMHKKRQVLTVTVGGTHRVNREEVERFLREGNASQPGEEGSNPPPTSTPSLDEE